MFIKLADYVRRSKPLSIPHRAVVKLVEDPDQTGRIKVDIKGIFDDIPMERRPWIYPWYGADLGSTTGKISRFMVPRLESEVVVTFPYEDIYFGFYVGHWLNSQVSPSVGTDDYPDVYGFKDDRGNTVKVNLSTDVVDFTHHSGTTLRIAADGEVTLNAEKDVNVTGDVIWLNQGTGVITEQSYDPFTRRHHSDGSTVVKAGH